MATAGASISPNTTVSDYREETNYLFCSCFTMPEDGTLDSLHVYVKAESSRFRAGVYTGGASDTDMTGATLVFGSDLQSDPTEAGWVTITAGDEALSSGARIWIGVTMEYSAQVTLANSANNATADTSFGTIAVRYIAGVDADNALPASIASSATVTTSYVVKAYLTYSAGGAASIVPHAMASYRQQ